MGYGCGTGSHVHEKWSKCWAFAIHTIAVFVWRHGANKWNPSFSKFNSSARAETILFANEIHISHEIQLKPVFIVWVSQANWMRPLNISPNTHKKYKPKKLNCIVMNGLITRLTCLCALRRWGRNIEDNAQRGQRHHFFRSRTSETWKCVFQQFGRGSVHWWAFVCLSGRPAVCIMQRTI